MNVGRVMSAAALCFTHFYAFIALQFFDRFVTATKDIYPGLLDFFPNFLPLSLSAISPVDRASTHPILTFDTVLTNYMAHRYKVRVKQS